MDLTVRGSGTLSGRACAGIQVQNGSLAVNADLTIDHLLNDIDYWTVGSYGLVSSEDILILGGNDEGLQYAHQCQKRYHQRRQSDGGYGEQHARRD